MEKDILRKLMEKFLSPFSNEGLSLTYDDLLVYTQYTEFPPSEAILKTRLTRNIDINVPLVSAAMDRVTESRLAIATANQGGIGIIHKNMSVEDQAKHVRDTKYWTSFKIPKPDSVLISDPFNVVLELLKKRTHSTLVVKDATGNKVVGLLVGGKIRDFHQLHKKGETVLIKDIMINREDLLIHKKSIDIKQAKEILMYDKLARKIIFLEEPTGLFNGIIHGKDLRKMEEYPLASKDKKERLMVGAAIGIQDEDLHRVEALVKAEVDVLSIDSSHANSKATIEFIKKVKKNFPTIDLIGGNVASLDGAKRLADAGIDAVKVGIGPGSICSTRQQTGAGVPQLSATHLAYQALKEYDVPIIADGGIRYPGDIVKAIIAGASSVMMGSKFAATYESPGDVYRRHGKLYKNYRGMGSKAAMKQGSAERYFLDPSNEKKLVEEGVDGEIPVSGHVSDVFVVYKAALQGGMGHSGTRTIPELQERGIMTRQTQAGISESLPHDIIITKEGINN